MNRNRQQLLWENLEIPNNGMHLNVANLGFEEKLWSAANKLRHNIDASEYKHIVLGLIFLKYISDLYSLVTPNSNSKNSKQKILFKIPSKAHWNFLLENRHSKRIGFLIDDAMKLIEKSSPEINNVLPKVYSRSHLYASRISELIELISSIEFLDNENESKDILGRVYEYFLGKFAEAEGNRGGQFYTPRSVVKLLVEMIEPYEGKIYDPCCGSGGMFVQSKKFVEIHKGNPKRIKIYGQESNQTTWRLCKMNLIRLGVKSDIQWNNEGSFFKDAHDGLKADYIIANPPFNYSDWGIEKLLNDKRWIYGVPPKSNANFAWIQHFISHLNNSGIAGFVLSNGSLSSNTSNEGEIRRKLIENDLVDCIVGLPDKLFYNTQISACLWFICMNKNDSKFRNRKHEVLFINAKSYGDLVSRRHRELSDSELKRITETYHSWRNKNGKYKNQRGFCQLATISEIKKHKFALVPGRYTGPEPLKLKPFTNDEIESFKDIVAKRFHILKELESLYTDIFDKL